MAELDALTATPRHKPAADQIPPKPITGLLSRAAIFLLVAALPFFPSQAPEFVNQTLLTRGWELLHLLLVGIAVSYGLFSQRNAPEPASEKEAALRGSTADGTPQSYLTQLLQVSPVFDEEGPGSPAGPEESRLQMWTSRYQRGKPAVLVAPGSPGEGRPLLLPVRSLRSIARRADSPGRKEEYEKHWIAGAGALSCPRGSAEDRKVREAGAVDCPPAAQRKDLAGVDLPSDIPWRSRSARMDPMEETADAVAVRSLSFRSLPSRPSSAGRISPPPPPLSPEPRAKSNEDPWKRKVLFNASPPPPPPPPPPFFHRTPIPPPVEKVACRSFSDELTTSNAVRNRGGDDDREWSSDDLGSPRSPKHSYYSMGRSVRTVRPREVLRDAMAGVATPVTVTREKEKRKKKKTTTETEDKAAATASDARGSDEASGRPSDAGELPGAAAAAAAGGAGSEQSQDAEENEVDKKADEFIAKFREQIRLQRIDFIKKTAAPGTLPKP